MELIDVKILNTTIERNVNKELAAYQITAAQADILIYLHRHPDDTICQKDIEAALSLSHPTVSSILKRLEEKKLITTAPLPDDHRFKQINLTPKSQAVISDLFKKIDNIYLQAVKGFTSDEINHFTEFLHRMKDNLK